MPEGDTIHRTAASLTRVLVGRVLETFEAPRLGPPFPAPGSVISAIEARGKHLLITFGDGLILHTHMRMTGSWHLYRPEAEWKRDSARVILTVPGAVAVCFSAPVVEMLDHDALARHPVLRRLGPDLCTAAPDIDGALERMGRIPAPDAEIGDVLLNQGVASGIGNVYKSEVLFIHRVHPATPLSRVDLGTRRELLSSAAALLRRNLDGFKRTTVRGAAPGTVYVYDRAGRPCRRCRTPIAVRHQGEHARITYWCPSCQGTGSARA